MKSSYPTLDYIVSVSLVKEFSFFTELKGMFKNSCIYKGGIKRLPKMTGYSKTKINRGIKIIIEQGWGKWHHGNLILQSGQKIHGTYADYKAKNFIKINNIQDIYLTLLKNKIQKKKYIKTKISDLKSKVRKVAKAAKKKLGERNFVNDGTSLKTLSKVFGVSSSQVSRILNTLAKKGLIKIIKRRQLVGKFTPKLFSVLKERYKGLYLSGGYLWYNLSSKVSVLPYNNVA